MGNVAVRVEHIGKRYTLGHAPGSALRRALAGLRPRRRVDDGRDEVVWALDDLSFEVKKGEAVGVIGGNGAGKSTLLKILARITRPTRGAFTLQGRVGSLLEVGSGFHPELTGRENVFLNGAILGMRKAEIERKLDQIVEFSGVAPFIDTPVKHYSSGMYVRLAFSVAAHLEHEIVLVDEVLSVGDAEFQSKCMARMRDISREGRTVLLVSHNLTTINRFCERTIWLDAGAVRQDSQTARALEAYLSHGVTDAGVVQYVEAPHQEAQITKIEVLNSSGDVSPAIMLELPASIRIGYRLNRPLTGYRVGIRIRTPDGIDVMTSTTTDADARLLSNEAGDYRATVVIPPRLLMPGRYLVTTHIAQPGARNLDRREDALAFQISGRARAYLEREYGLISTLLDWTCEDVTKQPISQTE